MKIKHRVHQMLILKKKMVFVMFFQDHKIPFIKFALSASKQQQQQKSVK